MDERADRGEFYPGGREGGVPPGTDTDKVDRVNLGELGESYTLKEVKNKVNQIVRAIAPVAVCIALCACAATAPLEDLPNTAPVVTNEEDAVAMAAVGALGAAVSNRVEAAEGALQAEIAGATNAVVQAALRAAEAESNRVDATYAKRSEIPAAPDLAPYALKSELPKDYLTENDITNFATRAWISAQGWATEAGVGARLDAQDLAIDAATNALWLAHAAGQARLVAATNEVWLAHAAEQARLVAATNEVWQSAHRADEALQREIDALRIVAADSNAVTRLVTQDGTVWQDATGTVWQVQDALGPWQATTSSVQFVSWEDFSTEEYDLWKIYFSVDGTNAEGYAANPAGLTSYTLPAGEWEYSGLSVYGDFPVTFVRPTIPGGATNAVDRVVYTNDLAAATNAAYEAAVAEAQERITRLEEMGTVLAATRLVDQTGGGYDDVTPETVARKQDALPYPTNAIPYAAISGAPSGGPEWTISVQDGDYIQYVTNGMARVRWWDYTYTDISDMSAWPDGAAMFVRFEKQEPITSWSVGNRILLVGYGTWPTNNFQSVWWRSGTNIFVNILLEE